MDRFCFGALAASAVLLFGCSSQVFDKDPLFGYRDESYRIPYYLPATRISVELLKNKDANATPRFGILIDPAKSVSYPDADARRTISYRPDSLSDDDLCISRTATGLLSLVSFTAADRSGDVLVSLAEIAAMAASGMPKMPTAVREFVSGTTDRYVDEALKDFIGPLSRDQSKVIYSGLFDPTIATEADSANSDVQNILQQEFESLVYSLSYEGHKEGETVKCMAEEETEKNKNAKPKRTPDELKKAAQECAETRAHNDADISKAAAAGKITFAMNFDPLPSPTSDGGYHKCEPANGEVCYRTFAAVPMTIKVQDQDIFTGQVALLNTNAEEGIPVYRARLVQKVTSLSFNDGVLTGISLQSPSQMKAVARLPISLAGAVLEAPASFFTAIARGFQSQAQAVEAKAKMLMALAELQKAQNGQTASPGSTTPTGTPDWGALNADTAGKIEHSGECSVAKPKA